MSKIGGVRGAKGLPVNDWRGRWDKRSKITCWCCGGSHLVRYLSRKVITGTGKVWNISVSIRCVHIALNLLT